MKSRELQNRHYRHSSKYYIRMGVQTKLSLQLYTQPRSYKHEYVRTYMGSYFQPTQFLLHSRARAIWLQGKKRYSIPISSCTYEQVPQLWSILVCTNKQAKLYKASCPWGVGLRIIILAHIKSRKIRTAIAVQLYNDPNWSFFPPPAQQ